MVLILILPRLFSRRLLGHHNDFVSRLNHLTNILFLRGNKAQGFAAGFLVDLTRRRAAVSNASCATRLPASDFQTTPNIFHSF